MSQPKLLSDAIGKPLKLEGFKKNRADAWYLDNEQTVCVLNLQKSAYGPQYYINVAVWLKPLGQVQFPPEHQCHIRLRWESIIPSEKKELEELLNLSNTELSDEERIARITKLVQIYVLSFFRECASLEALRELYKSERLPRKS